MADIPIVWCIPMVLTPEKQEIIIGRRAHVHETVFPGEYEVVTGHVRASETMEKALYRELREEIGAKYGDVTRLIRLGGTSQLVDGKTLAGDVFIAVLQKDFEPIPEKNHEQPAKYSFESTGAFLHEFKKGHAIPIKWPDVNVLLQYADAIDDIVRRMAMLSGMARAESRERGRIPSRSIG